MNSIVDLCFTTYLLFSDDHWDDRDAQVVCKMLGFSKYGAIATHSSNYGSVVDNFIMDDVNCDGTEETLEDCGYNPTDNCGSSEGAGVICRSTTTPFDITLVGGTSSTLSAEGNIIYQGRPIW